MYLNDDNANTPQYLIASSLIFQDGLANADCWRGKAGLLIATLIPGFDPENHRVGDPNDF